MIVAARGWQQRIASALPQHPCAGLFDFDVSATEALFQLALALVGCTHLPASPGTDAGLLERRHQLSRSVQVRRTNILFEVRTFGLEQLTRLPLLASILP